MDILKEVESVYEGLRLTEPSQIIIGLATLVAVFAVVNKFIKVYKEAFSDGEKPASARHFFNLFYVYIYCVVAIVLAPALFKVIEQALGLFQDEMVARYAGKVNNSVTEEMMQYIEEYEEEVSDADFIEAAIMRVTQQITMTLYILFFGAQKYLFYMFAAGRYLYLLLLQIIAPFAVFAWIDESTRHYTQTFLKNLLVCYMMIPAFLIASTFADELAINFSQWMGMESKTNLLTAIFSFIFKLFLLGKAAGYVRQLV